MGTNTTTTTGATLPADVYNPNPYDWKTLLANYVDPTTAQYQTQARPFTPSYGYELQQLMTRNGQPPALRYDVADPAAASSAYANTVLQDYNTRNPTKTSSTFNQAALDNYIKNYNSANNINLAGFKKTVTPEQQAAILAQYGAGRTAVNDSMYNKYIKNYNTSNDLTAASEQQKIVDEYNASRTANQNTYNTNVADYNTRAADVQANPQTYYKPIEQYTKPVVQNAYYNKFVSKADGGLMQGYANGGVVQPQQSMVQDMMQQYNIPRQSISPLNALPSQQAPRPFYNGGAVRGYAGGDLVSADDPTNLQGYMDVPAPNFAPQVDAVQVEPTGGGAVPQPQTQPLAISGMPPGLQAMLSQYTTDSNDYGPDVKLAQTERRAQQTAFNTALDNLAKNQDTGPSKAEMYFRLMGAFGKPTKYGSFGESMGPVGEEMATYQGDLRKAKQANRALSTQTELKKQELALEGAKDTEKTLLGLQSEQKKDKREVVKSIIKEWIDSGKPQSEAGKIAKDLGFKVGTPDYEAEVGKQSKILLESKLATLNASLVGAQAQLGNLALATKKEERAASELDPTELKTLMENKLALKNSESASTLMDEALKYSNTAFTKSPADQALYNKLRYTNPNDPRVVATEQLEQTLTTSGLAGLRASFGGNPTEGERQVQLLTQGLGATSQASRKAIIGRVKDSLTKNTLFYSQSNKDLLSGAYKKKAQE
jgi:hypothetical protein